MIAGGVAVGVTVVALGGYKIIKKIQAQRDDDFAAIPMAARSRRIDEVHDTHELDELEPQELSRVEIWRRGIADVAEQSAGTSVDGEFITPGASRHLIDAGVLDEDDLKSRRSARSKRDTESRAPKSHRAKSERSVKTSKTSDTRRSKTVKESSSRKKEKEPSGLKMLFRSHTTRV